jgi:hypothetical protein
VIVHLDCLGGINAVSALAAAIDAGVDPAAIVDRLGFLPGPIGVRTPAPPAGDARGRRLAIDGPNVLHCRRSSDVIDLLERGDLLTREETIVRGVYRRLAAAEARVHGTTEDDVTFHEVGAARSVVAVLGLAVAIERLGPSDITVSPLPIGSGTVETHHGRLPVPAPATLALLEGVPVVAAGEGELVTPTGAAIARELATSFGPMPSMTVERVGTGIDDRRDPPPVTRLIVGSPAVLSAPTR